MATAPRFAEYGDLIEEVARLREGGDADAALALVEAEGPRLFPHQTAQVHLLRMSLAAELGRIDHAIQAFDEALAAGCRFPAPMLRDWPALAPLHDIVEFERLVHIAAMRYDAELGASRATLTVERPDIVAPPGGLPLLVGLHGNSDSAELNVPFWRVATERGFVVAVPGSAEIALSPGFFAWNDADRAHADVIAHVERLVREQRIDPARIVLAGFSAGARRALEIAYSPALKVRAVIAVAPWLPQDQAKPLASARPVRTFIAVGDRDRGNYEGSLALAERLTVQDVPVELEIVPEHGHRYPSFVTVSPGWRVLLGRALDFALAD